MKKTLKITWNVAFYAIILFILIFAIFSVVNKKNNGVAKVFGYSPVVVLTESMKGNNENSFNKGDLIIIKTVKDFSALRENEDIVTFYDFKDGQPIVNSHRVIKIIINTEGKKLFVTKGDNNPEQDTFLLEEKDIIGVYQSKIKGVGSAILWMQSSLGFFLIIVLPALIFLTYEVVKFVGILVTEKVAKQQTSEKEELQKMKEEIERLKKDKLKK